MAYKNLTPELERELSNALGPDFNAQQQNQLMAFADALLSKQAPQPKAKAAEESKPKPQARESAVEEVKPATAKKAK